MRTGTSGGQVPTSADGCRRVPTGADGYVGRRRSDVRRMHKIGGRRLPAGRCLPAASACIDVKAVGRPVVGDGRPEGHSR